MSKERLEEIKHQLEESNSYDDNPNGYWYHNISWLIEQAEQTIELVVAYDNAQKEIQILKNRIELLKDQYGTVNKGLHDDVSKFRKQNKRYREALHHIEENSNDKVAVFIASKALEES